MKSILYDIFDPAELSPWPGIDKEVTDEAKDVLMKFMRPTHIVEKVGAFDYSSVSKEARSLLLRSLSRVDANLIALKKRSKKYTTEDETDESVLHMLLFQLMVDQSFRSAGLTLGIPSANMSDEEREALVANVANAITRLTDVTNDFRAKLKEGDKHG